MNTLNRSLAPKFNQVEHIHFLPVGKKTLDNGILLDSIHGGSQEILKIDFVFRAGNWYNPKSLIASSTSKLIKEGTKSYSAFEIAEGIDQYGAFLDIENGFDTSTVTLYTLTRYLEDVLPYFKEVLLYPAFHEHEFEIFRTNALEKFKINQKKVSFVARNAFSAELFGNNPYGLVASETAYRELQLEDLKSFHKQHYQLGNCKILVSGNVNETTLNLINIHFGKEATGNAPAQPDHQNPDNSPRQVHLEKEGALQSAIRIGKIIPNKLHPDYLGLKVLNTILGGYFGSRLMQNIREDKGYTYGISSGVISMQHAGYFFIGTEVGSEVTQPALTEIYREVDKICQEPVSQDEIDLVKNYMLGEFLGSCDGPFKMASLFESVDAYGLNFEFYNDYINTIKKISPNTIMELGQKYLNKESFLEVVVGKP
ncbi:MAG: insulinase family protein [Flavobacteriales bacterium]|nr:insulinase family protein [Flavobacteriales bacterium]